MSMSNVDLGLARSRWRGAIQTYRLEIMYAVLATFAVGILVLLDHMGAFSSLDAATASIFNRHTQIGLVGVFAIAVVGNVSVVIQVPYTVPVLAAALAGSDAERMVLLGVAAGVGAAVGESIEYAVVDRVLSHKPGLSRSRLYRWVQRTVSEKPRRTQWIVFVWAASPLPDDTVIVPLALVSYGLKRISVPLFAGKVFHNTAMALVFFQFTAWSTGRVSPHIKADLMLGIVLLFVLFIAYQVHKARGATGLEAEVDPVEAR